MRRQEKSAKKIVQVLKSHKNVKQVFYPGETDSKEQLRLFKNQCKGSGALISFDITGGEKEAFKVLNAFKICRLAVSLGGTESLVEHPRSMTHSDVLPEDLDLYGVTEGMIRISVGIEHYEDLKNDVVQALDSLNLEC
jgi:methionine-gamma-lyase